MNVVPKISIVIPIYNHQKELRKTIASIEKQTYTDYEVIVVDDGSQVPVVEDPRYKLIKKANTGSPAARNRGLLEARGEYVIFWDADLIGNPQMLEKMVNVLHSNTDITFVYSSFYFGWKKMHAQPFNIKKLQKINYIHSTSLIRRKDAIQWDESLKKFQDWDYYLTLAEQEKKGYFIDEYLFKVIPAGTISAWLPSFMYKEPWSKLPIVRKRVERYMGAYQIIKEKHNL